MVNEDVADGPPTEPTTWAENTDNEGITSPIVLPDVLSQLYNKGLRFKKVPAFDWNYDGEQPKLSKCCSVYFSVDSVCTSQDILEAFNKAGIEIDEICSIQRKNSNRSWVVTFDSAATNVDISTEKKDPRDAKTQEKAKEGQKKAKDERKKRKEAERAKSYVRRRETKRHHAKSTTTTPIKHAAGESR